MLLMEGWEDDYHPVGTSWYAKRCLWQGRFFWGSLLSPLNYPSLICIKTSASQAGFVLAMTCPCHMWFLPFRPALPTMSLHQSFGGSRSCPLSAGFTGLPCFHACSALVLPSLLWDSEVMVGDVGIATDGSNSIRVGLE